VTKPAQTQVSRLLVKSQKPQSPHPQTISIPPNPPLKGGEKEGNGGEGSKKEA